MRLHTDQSVLADLREIIREMQTRTFIHIGGWTLKESTVEHSVYFAGEFRCETEKEWNMQSQI